MSSRDSIAFPHNWRSHPLAHFNERPASGEIEVLIVHSICCPPTGPDTAAGDPRRYDPKKCIELLDKHELSAHYLIDREGDIWVMVADSSRAWHAGKSELPEELGGKLAGVENVNDLSIGIELVGEPELAFSTEQYERLIELAAELIRKYPIKAILGHQHVARPIGRKIDPGSAFDWEKLRLGLLSRIAKTNEIVFPTALASPKD